jgi:hypothetical protein
MYLSLNRDRLLTVREIADSYAISKTHLTKVVHQLGVQVIDAPFDKAPAPPVAFAIARRFATSSAGWRYGLRHCADACLDDGRESH